MCGSLCMELGLFLGPVNGMEWTQDCGVMMDCTLPSCKLLVLSNSPCYLYVFAEEDDYQTTGYKSHVVERGSVGVSTNQEMARPNRVLREKL